MFIKSDASKFLLLYIPVLIVRGFHELVGFVFKVKSIIYNNNMIGF